MKHTIKPEKDTFGQEMWAYYKGNDVGEIIERDDGFFDVSKWGAKAYFSEYKNWPNHEKTAMKFARSKVLDIGCGVGRHALYLQKNGLDVTAIDNSPLAIKLSKLRGVKRAMVMSITDIDKLKSRFDTIIMLGNNFGLFGNFKQAKILLKKMYKKTSPNALIIAESLDPYNTNRKVHLDYHKFNKKRGRMPGQTRLRIRFEKNVGEWFEYLFVSKKEMKQILEGTGWKVKKFIDGKRTYIAIIEKV